MTARRGRAGVHLLLAITVALAAVVVSVTVGRDYRPLASTSEVFKRHSYTPSYDPLSNVEKGLLPNTVDVRGSVPSPQIRGIALHPDLVVLLAGGRPVRQIPLLRPVTTLPDLAARVADPAWISDDGRGTVQVKAAVVVEVDASLRIAAPVRTVVLTAARGVLLGVDHGSLVLDGVTVMPSGKVQDPDAVGANDRRPFVLAVHAATLTISHSHVHDLGRDWNSSYGISWSDRSTGSMTDSEVDHNFIGMYSDHASDVTVAHNWLHDNTLYGVDPHSYSTGMVIRQNISEHNGRHGIIFSDHVTNSVVEGNTTRYNNLNGIMMDEQSTGNRVLDNTSIGNRGDGIVLAGSSGNRISGNQLLDNRVGVQVRGGSIGTVAADNTIRGNQVAAQGIVLAGNVVTRNGTQWRRATLGKIWSAAAVLLLVLSGCTEAARRRRARSISGYGQPRRHSASARGA